MGGNLGVHLSLWLELGSGNAAKHNFGNKCGRSPYYEAGMDTAEVILLPGSRLVIESVQGPTNTTTYTTVSARQRTAIYPDRIG